MEGFQGETHTPEIETLVAAALRALAVAESRPGRDREAAFALLAADGLMTLAVERLSEAEDPAEGLKDLVEQIVAGGTGGPD